MKIYDYRLFSPEQIKAYTSYPDGVPEFTLDLNDKPMALLNRSALVELREPVAQALRQGFRWKMGESPFHVVFEKETDSSQFDE